MTETEKRAPYILLVEDDRGTVMLAAKRLAGLWYKVKEANSAEAALAAIKEAPPVLMLLDYSLPGKNALEFVDELKARGEVCPPFIVMTGHGGEDVAVSMLRAGARDYLIKNNNFLELLPAVVKRVLAELEAAGRLEAAGLAIRESEDRYRSLFNQARDSIMLLEPLPGGLPLIWDANEAALAMHGYSSEELIGKSISVLDQEIPASAVKERLKQAQTPAGALFETRHRRKDGSFLDVQVSLKSMLIGGRSLLLDISRDITEKKRYTEVLQEAVQMQSVLNEMMKRSLLNMPLRDKLEANLAALLAAHWLSPDLKGAVFLTAPGGNELVLTAQKGLPPELLACCAKVPLGRCLCGQAAASGRAVSARSVGPEHQITYEGMEPHGHFCAPIMAEGKVLGVLNVYLEAGSVLTESQERFIKAAADVMAENIIRSRVEEQFSQAQKMEAVGLLAGGIAHDFNNILTAIKGYCTLVTNSLIPEDPSREDMREIMTAADRASALTRQLLAFGRRQIMVLKVLDLNKTIGDMMNMLRRIMGENVPLSVKLFPSPCPAKVDPGQIEQVIVNLVVNARDAVANGGEITLETEVLVPADNFFSARPDLPRGKYVRVIVRDTGCGMSEEVKGRIFEPFFTTKAAGKGTGLGLPTVFGIVKQSGGEIQVESELGKGTAFFIYLPLAEAAPADAEKEKAPEVPAKGHETVMLVEDEESLRRLGERVLSAAGYTVIAAADGPAALKLMEKRGKPVDLLMTDIVMPGMSGQELALELRRRKLAGRVLYTSGYTDDSAAFKGTPAPGMAFIYKPYAVDALLQKLREVLDAAPDKAASP
ncbi:MAG: response regulator [Elusimicrobiales bacterium]|nr:response regulator [Elusimicrobiales bacterium]